MQDKFHCLGITDQVQKQSIQVLEEARRGFMRSDLFRQRLIRSLAASRFGSLTISKINFEIEALVEQKLLIRQTRRGEHEIGLNKVIWRLTPEIISLIYVATKKANISQLFNDDLRHLVLEVRQALKNEDIGRAGVRDAALLLLVGRFRTLGYCL